MWFCLTRSHETPSLRSPTTQTAGGEVHSAEPPLFPASAFTPTGIGGLATAWAHYDIRKKLNEISTGEKQKATKKMHSEQTTK